MANCMAGHLRFNGTALEDELHYRSTPAWSARLLHLLQRFGWGPVQLRGTYVVSPDGKALTATTFGYDTQLRQFKQKTVWDRSS
jgi:hypothetical protein